MMILGGYTFPANPGEIDSMFDAERDCAYLKTWESVGFFSWGASIVGKKITFNWPYMLCTMYDQLAALRDADAEIVLDPDLGGTSPPTYNVQILNLNGKYFLSQGTTEGGATAYRQDVTLELLIMSEAT